MEDLMSKEDLASSLSIGLDEVDAMVKQGLPNFDFAGKKWFLKSSVLKFFRDMEPKATEPKNESALRLTHEEPSKVKLAQPSRS